MVSARPAPFHVNLPSRLARDFKVVCAEQETTMSAVVRAHIIDYVHRHKKHSSVVE